jgi:hypothetical protein
MPTIANAMRTVRSTSAVAIVVGALLANGVRAQAPVAPSIAAPRPEAAGVGPSVDPTKVPTYMDVVQRGMRLRFDVAGRAVGVGNPDSPVRLEVDERTEKNDLDVGGAVIFGYDRAFGVPLALDLMSDFGADVFGDSPVSPFLDDQSKQPRVRLYSAFIALSGTPGEPSLFPIRVRLGRMTEIVESPVTYDGLSFGYEAKLSGKNRVGVKLWGGLDAPQRLAGDLLSPFTRIDPRAYAENYALNPTFIADPGSVYVSRKTIDEPILRGVGGLRVDGRFSGVGFLLQHSLMPAQTLWIDDANNDNDLLLPLQRTVAVVDYRYDEEWMTATAGLELKATDFLPRQLGLKLDGLSGDGVLRVYGNVRFQFLEDITAYDSTFRAFAPQQQFAFEGTGDAIGNVAQEQLRVRDQIRHLNFAPPQEHLFAHLEAERQLGSGFSVLARVRLRQHIDATDVDMFRNNFYEAALGGSWSPGFAIDIGDELSGGFVNSGDQDGRAYDLKAEGLQSYAENRLWLRWVLIEGRLQTLAEVFVRRQDVLTKRVSAFGQWSGAVAGSVRYDISDNIGVSARLDGDALSPIDALNASYYLGAMFATSIRF